MTDYTANVLNQPISPADPNVPNWIQALQGQGIDVAALFNSIAGAGGDNGNGQQQPQASGNGFADASAKLSNIGAAMQQRRQMAALRRQTAPVGAGGTGVMAPQAGLPGMGNLYDTLFGGGAA